MPSFPAKRPLHSVGQGTEPWWWGRVADPGLQCAGPGSSPNPTLPPTLTSTPAVWGHEAALIPDPTAGGRSPDPGSCHAGLCGAPDPDPCCTEPCGRLNPDPCCGGQAAASTLIPAVQDWVAALTLTPTPTVQDCTAALTLDTTMRGCVADRTPDTARPRTLLCGAGR
ncbi:hypothetical protein UY3_10294 [Chelonia mydas]|uniref:Uncharacterized protein n=1 Tax=Chelonia mydas TaxID=8469 RepID=M7B623_CHEMY|nr:hypothetical protein UY3_10294 [Chelonia mydas]